MGYTNVSGIAGDEGFEDGLLRGFSLSPFDPNFATYFADFTSASELDLTNDWVESDVGTQTLDPTTRLNHDGGAQGGFFYIDSDAEDGDGIVLQRSAAAGSAEHIQGDTDFVAWASLGHQAPTTAHWFWGVGETSGSFMDADGDLAGAIQYVGFTHNADDHGDGVARLVYANTTYTEVTPIRTVPAMLVTPFTIFGIRVTNEGKDIEWYVNGIKVGEVKQSSGFSAGMCLTWTNVMGTASGDRFWTDAACVIQRRQGRETVESGA